MKNKQTKAADLTQEEYKKYPFTWWQENAIYVIGGVVSVIFLTGWILLVNC